MKGFDIPTVQLSLDTLIRECSNRKIPKEDLFYQFCSWNRENVHEVFKYRKFNYDFIDYLTLYNDGEHVLGYVGPSYDDFLINICRFLGIWKRKDTKDDQDLTNRLLERIERLRNIRSEYELRREFPILYDDLVQGRNYIRNVESMPQNTEEEQERYNEMRHYYYACGLRFRLDRFVQTQAEVYTRFVTRRKEYKELIQNKSFNSFFRNNFNMDKVAMLAVHGYLLKCEGATDEETYDKYMNLINLYLESNYDKEVAITTTKGVIVNRRTIEERLQKLKKRHPEKEVLAGWELVPEGKEVRKATQVSGPRSILMQEVDIDALKRAGERKENFYANSAYTAKVIGLEKYKGYVGYIYPNGEVLLDREYHEETPKSDKENAIYNMKVGDFETLSRLDKTVLRKHPKVGRIYHSKNWEKKAQEIVDRLGTIEDQVEVLRLVKKLKERRA